MALSKEKIKSRGKSGNLAKKGAGKSGNLAKKGAGKSGNLAKKGAGKSGNLDILDKYSVKECNTASKVKKTELSLSQNNGVKLSPDGVKLSPDCVKLSQVDLVKFMLKKESYPEKTNKVEHKETHISHVFLTEKFAYKLKKPVNFGFLDFTSLEKRKFYCSEEIRLNKRLSPNLYLGVEKITISKNGSLEFNGNGTIFEYAVKMKRFPESAIMTELVKNNKVDDKIIAELARIISDFHKKEISKEKKDNDLLKYGGMDSVKKATDQNFTQTEKYIGYLIDRKKFDFIKDATNNFFLGKQGLFESRLKHNKVIEYHGDLHTGNIFIYKNKIQIFDCIEFNNEFRCGDVMNDIAFLAMDLDFLGREDLSKYFVWKYIEFTSDNKGYALLNFFKCYRAYVRAKVTSFMLDNPNLTKNERIELEIKAKKYYWLSLEYARNIYSPKPVLMICCGMSGSGKSRWLKFASDIVGATVISTDAERRKIFGLTGKEKKDDNYRKKYYSEESMQKVYEHVFNKAESILSNDGKVSIDASFIKKSNRDMARRVADKYHADFILLYTSAKDETVKKRIVSRQKGGNSVSDADITHAFMYQKKFFEVPTADEPCISIDTDNHISVNISMLKKKLNSIFINTTKA